MGGGGGAVVDEGEKSFRAGEQATDLHTQNREGCRVVLFSCAYLVLHSFPLSDKAKRDHETARNSSQQPYEQLSSRKTDTRWMVPGLG